MVGPTPESPSLPHLLFRGLWLPSKRRWTACPGTRAGSQAQLAWAETPATSMGLHLPHRQELKHTLASRWQMTGTSFLMTNSSSSCCWRPLLHVPPVSALTGPQTTWGMCCCYLCGRRQAEEERGRRGYSLARCILVGSQPPSTETSLLPCVET